MAINVKFPNNILRIAYFQHFSLEFQTRSTHLMTGYSQICPYIWLYGGPVDIVNPR